MNERSNKGKEFFRTSEYNAIPEHNPKRSIASVDDSVTSLDFDESTHRKNGYSSSLNTSRREQQKSTTQTAVLATAGTVSMVTVIAAILAIIVGISFVSFSASLTELTCIVDIPEDMAGDFVGVLYDSDGNEAAKTEVNGSGECEFAFTGLFPETQYYFSIFDADGTQYLYETVSTAAGTQPLIVTTSEENQPFAVKISFKVYNPVSTSFNVTLIYDEATENEERDTFSMPDDGIVTARKEFAENVRIIIEDADGTAYFDSSYPLHGFTYETTEDTGTVSESSISFSVNVINPNGFALSALLTDSESGKIIAVKPLTQGLNDLTFSNLSKGLYDAFIEDASGNRYAIGSYRVGTP